LLWPLQGKGGVLKNCDFLGDKDLIVGGDLNLILSAREVSGDNARLDLQSFYFSDMFSKMGLVDVLLGLLTPT